MGNDIDVIGPMARSATDLELALRLLAGPNDHDGVAWKVSLPKPSAKPWRQWRVAVLPDAATAPVDDAVQERIRAVANFAARQGARVSDKARPAVDLDEAHRVFIGLLRAATSRGASDAAFAGFTTRARRVRPDATDYQSRMLRGVTMTHREWLALNDARHRMRLAWTEFFRDWDVLLCPAGATTAFPHNQTGERWERMVSVNGRPQPSTTQMFWAGMSGMVYLPSTVAPAGLAADGLPVGVQIIGPQWADLTCIAFAKMLEKDFGGFTPPPGCA
jgi:amidase